MLWNRRTKKFKGISTIRETEKRRTERTTFANRLFLLSALFEKVIKSFGNHFLWYVFKATRRAGKKLTKEPDINICKVVRS